MKSPTAATFRDPLLRALGRLTGLQAGVPVGIDDVLPVVYEEAGVKEDEWGSDTLGRPQVRTWVLQAFNRKLKPLSLAENMGRGRWALTEDGVQVASVLLSTTAKKVPTPDPTPEEAPMNEPVSAPVEDTGVPWDWGVLEDSIGDPYFVDLAAQEVQCLGYWSPKAKACASCSILGTCKGKAVEILEEIAARMQTASDHAEDDASSAEIDEIIDLIGEAQDATVPTFSRSDLNVSVATICRGCRQDIPAGSQGVWIRNSSDVSLNGVYHLDCWNARQRSWQDG